MSDGGYPYPQGSRACHREGVTDLSAPGRGRRFAWAAAVAVVLADSSIVTLALPEILVQFDTSVFGVSWVLTAFNLVLALAILPAASFARRSPATTWRLGIAGFALASLACAVAPSIAVLIVARCLQALAGAAAIAAAIELLAGAYGSHERAATVWGGAGVAGLALGPAAGGILTELLSWEAIFAFQVPLLLALPAAPSAARARLEERRAGPVHPAPEAALALLSAGLTGALFLLVLLLTEGWRYSPLEAAAVVSVMPAVTLVAAAALRRVTLDPPLQLAGALLIAGGLAALGLLPGAEFGWVLAPQALIGVGIALALPGLTGAALAGGGGGGRRAAGTIAARHAGVVVGIIALTPVFTAQLSDEHDAVLRSGTALLLDAPLSPQTKIELGGAIADRVEVAEGELPSLEPAFAAVESPPEATSAYEQLEVALEDEIDRAATHAFSAAFLGAGAFALLAAVPTWLGARRRR
jgi:MFS family permease